MYIGVVASGCHKDSSQLEEAVLQNFSRSVDVLEAAFRLLKLKTWVAMGISYRHSCNNSYKWFTNS